MDPIDRGAQESNVNLSLAQCLILDGREYVSALYVESRKSPTIVGHDPVDDSSKPGSNADFDPPPLSLLCVSCQIHGISRLDDQFLRFFQENTPCVG
jgi:hypothetical protein